MQYCKDHYVQTENCNVNLAVLVASERNGATKQKDQRGNKDSSLHQLQEMVSCCSASLDVSK
jgi:hypothetical protein